MADTFELTENKSIKPRLVELINSMTEDQCQRLFQKLQTIIPKDQRGHHRAACSIPVDYTTQKGSFSGFVKDISKGGVFIETRAHLDVGEKIKLTFSSLTQPNSIRIVGRIVRKNMLGAGVEFEKTTEVTEKSTWIDCRRNMAEISKEQRVDPRVDLQCPVYIEGIRDQKTITDLSIGGVFVECDSASRNKFRTGQLIRLTIKLPTEDDMIQVPAEVVSYSDRGMHCQFAPLDRRTEDAIYGCFSVAKHTIPIK